MFRLGITGSIATGKSTILMVFTDLGVPVFSADAAVTALYSDSVVEAVEALFPDVVVHDRIDRARLSQKLAVDPSGFRQLEAIIHPLIRTQITQFMIDAEALGQPLAVVEVPLLFESGYDYGFDAVAVTFVKEAVQRQRALARPGMTVDKFNAILARQLPQSEKKKRATYLFDTGLPLQDTQRQVAQLVTSLGKRMQ